MSEKSRIMGIPPGQRRPDVDIKVPDPESARPEGFNPRGPLSKSRDSESWGEVVRRFFVRRGLISPRR